MKTKALFLPFVVLFPIVLIAGAAFLAHGLLVQHSRDQSIEWSQDTGNGTVFPACNSAQPSGTCASDGTAQETISWSYSLGAYNTTCRNAYLYLNGSLVYTGNCDGSYTLTGLQPNQSYTCNLEEVGVGNQTDNNDCSFTTNNCAVTAPPPQVVLTANGQQSITISAGQNYTLAWNSANASTCVLSDSRTDGYPNDPPENIPGNTAGSAPTGMIGTYTLTCQGPGGTGQAAAVINKQAAVCPDGSAAPNNDTTQCTCSQGNQNACTNAAPACTFSATANGQTGSNIVATPGTTVNYTFGNTNCASVNFQDSVDGGSQGPWISGSCYTSSSGGTINQGQVGHSYNLSYTVTNSSGQQAMCQVTVEVDSGPSCNFSAIDTTQGGSGYSNNLVVNTGDQITYNFVNTDCANTQTGVSVDNQNGTPGSWLGNLPCSQTSNSGTIAQDEAGHTYYLYYDVFNSNNQEQSCETTIKVNALAKCQDGSAAPNNDAAQCTCSQGNTSACNTGLPGNTSGPPNSCPANYSGTYPYCKPNPGAPIACNMYFSPATIYSNGESTLYWSADSAGTMYYVGGTFAVPASGNGQVSAPESTTYSLLASSGSYCYATLNVSQCSANQGSSCTSAPNDCGLTNGTIQCDGSCAPPSDDECTAPPTVVQWSLRPTLVQSGETTSVVWQVQNAAQCTVTGSNGDSWTGSSGSKTSSPITAQTVYTLHCTAFPHALPPTPVQQTATVNITPGFNEE